VGSGTRIYTQHLSEFVISENKNDLVIYVPLAAKRIPNLTSCHNKSFFSPGLFADHYFLF